MIYTTMDEDLKKFEKVAEKEAEKVFAKRVDEFSREVEEKTRDRVLRIISENEKDRIREVVELVLANFLASDRYTFQKHLQLFNGRDIILGTGRGTSIGTESTQKLAFYGGTPVVRQATFNSVGNVSGTYSQTEVQAIVDAVNTIRLRLISYNLIAS